MQDFQVEPHPSTKTNSSPPLVEVHHSSCFCQRLLESTKFQHNRAATSQTRSYARFSSGAPPIHRNQLKPTPCGSPSQQEWRMSQCTGRAGHLKHSTYAQCHKQSCQSKSGFCGGMISHTPSAHTICV